MPRRFADSIGLASSWPRCERQGSRAKRLTPRPTKSPCGLERFSTITMKGGDGPLLDHFKRVVEKAVKKLVAKACRCRNNTLKNTFPLAFISLPEKDQRIIEEFRKVVHKRLGTLGVAVFDAQLGGGKVGSLVGEVDLGNPTTDLVKTIVKRLKNLAVEYGQRTGDPEFLRRATKATAAWRAEG